jgi:hypothetical protein
VTTVGPQAGAVDRADVAQTMLTRLLEVAGLICIPTIISLLAIASPTRTTISVLTYYKPLFLFSRPQTLIGSAFYLPNVAMVGVTTVLTVALFVPYVLARGAAWSVRVFLTGHVLATLAVAVVVIPGDWLGWRSAIHIVHSSDVGASAGLAACAGGLAVLVGRRWRWAGALILIGLYGYFLHHLAGERLIRGLADLEHITAVTTGVALELWWLPRNGGHLLPRRARGSGPSIRS